MYFEGQLQSAPPPSYNRYQPHPLALGQAQPFTTRHHIHVSCIDEIIIYIFTSQRARFTTCMCAQTLSSQFSLQPYIQSPSIFVILVCPLSLCAFSSLSLVHKNIFTRQECSIDKQHTTNLQFPSSSFTTIN